MWVSLIIHTLNQWLAVSAAAAPRSVVTRGLVRRNADPLTPRVRLVAQHLGEGCNSTPCVRIFPRLGQQLFERLDERIDIHRVAGNRHRAIGIKPGDNPARPARWPGLAVLPLGLELPNQAGRGSVSPPRAARQATVTFHRRGHPPTGWRRYGAISPRCTCSRIGSGSFNSFKRLDVAVSDRPSFFAAVVALHPVSRIRRSIASAISIGEFSTR